MYSFGVLLWEISNCSCPYGNTGKNLKLLMYEALSYMCMRPSATSVSGLKLLVYEASSY